MTLQDTPAFNRAFNELADLYNLTEYEDQRLRYFQALNVLTICEFEGACTEASKRAGIGNCRFLPLPGTLRGFAQELASNVHRDGAASTSCDKCGGTGMMAAEPDMALVRRLYYSHDDPAAVAQQTVTRCACRS